jgi:ParB/RepB/Spo0J family partition protein
VNTIIKPVEVSHIILPPQFRTDLGREDDLRRLGENILSIGQLAPIGLLLTMELLYGFRRVAASILVGIKYLDARIYDKPLSEEEIQCINFSENVQRRDLSAFEKWQACEQMLKLNPSWTASQLAKRVNLDPSAITKMLAPSKLIPDWQEALKNGEVGSSDCYQASLAPRDQQLALLVMKRAGASREVLSRAVRRTKPTKRQAGAKSSRLSIVQPDGTKIVISGRISTMTDVVEKIAECSEAARKGQRERMDVKTFEAWMRDKSNPTSGGNSDV